MGQYYNQMGEASLQSRVASGYYKVGQELLQNVAGNLLQSGATLLVQGS